MRVFHQNPEGVVSVKFKTEKAADECTRVMNGRFFSGRQLEAFKWDGTNNYHIKARLWAGLRMCPLLLRGCGGPEGVLRAKSHGLGSSSQVTAAIRATVRPVRCLAMRDEASLN